MKPQNDIFAPTPLEAIFRISSLFFTNCDVLYSYIKQFAFSVPKIFQRKLYKFSDSLKNTICISVLSETKQVFFVFDLRIKLILFIREMTFNSS